MHNANANLPPNHLLQLVLFLTQRSSSTITLRPPQLPSPRIPPHNLNTTVLPSTNPQHNTFLHHPHTATSLLLSLRAFRNHHFRELVALFLTCDGQGRMFKHEFDNVEWKRNDKSFKLVGVGRGRESGRVRRLDV